MDQTTDMPTTTGAKSSPGESRFNAHLLRILTGCHSLTFLWSRKLTEFMPL